MTKPTKWPVRPTKTDQPGHPPSLIRVFTVRMKKHWVLSYPISAQRRLWSVWVLAQADLSLLGAKVIFFGFAMCRLISHFELSQSRRREESRRSSHQQVHVEQGIPTCTVIILSFWTDILNWRAVWSGCTLFAILWNMILWYNHIVRI